MISLKSSVSPSPAPQIKQTNKYHKTINKMFINKVEPLKKIQQLIFLIKLPKMLKHTRIITVILTPM